jgi:uncharacterized protein (TIGR03382 family)
MKALWIVVAAVLLSTPSSYAGVITYITSLSGPNESPANASPGTGSATVIVDTTAQMMEVIVTFSGLTSGTTASHIHCCTAAPFTGTAGVATTTPTFTAFPLGVTSGSYDHLFDLTLAGSYNPAFVTANGGTVASAEAVLLAGLASGTTYLNIHTTNFPNGEIRGFLVSATPEPGTLTLALGALAGVGLLRRRKR